MPSIKSFRDKKVRILNGSHTGMVTIGLQLGCQTVMDAFNMPAIEKFVTTMVNEEVLPMIDEPIDDLKAFAAGILERFYNPYIRHMLASICLNSLSKWEARNFPTVKDNFLKAGKVAKYNLFSLASLFVLYSGKSEVDFKVEDTPEYVALIRENWDVNDINGTVEKIIKSQIWVEDLTVVTPLIPTVAGYVKDILSEGMAQALHKLVG